MPVPTDTFWKISRLNKVFAVSAVVLLGTFGWAVLQDFDKQWRKPQIAGKVWEAALVSERLEDRDGIEERAKQLDRQIEQKREQVETQNKDYDRLTAERNQAT